MICSALRNLAGAILLLCLMGDMAFAAECVAPLQPPPLNFCKRCTTVLAVATRHDVSCTAFPPRGGNMGDVVMLGAKLAKKPAHGSVSVNSSSWTYTPAKGFTGRDTFTMERDYLQNNQLFVIYVQIEMDVN